jgi:hypothetical protein
LTTTILPTTMEKRKRRFKDGPTLLVGKRTRDSALLEFERTALLTRESAGLLCAMLQASGEIALAEVRRDRHRRCTPVRFYVRFRRSSSSSSLSAQGEAFRAIRQERAVRQFAEMVQLPGDEPGWYMTLHIYPEGHPLYGEVGIYQTHPDGQCSCPDATYREIVRGEAHCKHVHRLRGELGLPEIRSGVVSRFPDTAEGRQARRAWFEANVGRDF